MDLESYKLGFRDGFQAAGGLPLEGSLQARGRAMRFEDEKPKRKVRQSPKQKLLTQMTKKKWDKYKKGRGRKTYVQIRAEVSRSQAFKKKAKRL